MSKRSAVMLPLFFALSGAAFLAAPAGVASAQSYPDDQAVQGRSHALPDGVQSVSPDSLDATSQDSDSIDATAQGADANLEGAQKEIRAHSASPDSITTHAEDVSDLPAASVVDQPIAPASIAPPPPLPESCGQPAGDRGWTACLAAVQAQLSSAQQRLSDADGALSRSITGNVNLGSERAAIIQQRDAARSDVATLTATLQSQVSQAQQSGASSTVTDPYQPKTQNQGW